MYRLAAKKMGEEHRDLMNGNWSWGREENTKRSLRQLHDYKSLQILNRKKKGTKIKLSYIFKGKQQCARQTYAPIKSYNSYARCVKIFFHPGFIETIAHPHSGKTCPGPNEAPTDTGDQRNLFDKIEKDKGTFKLDKTCPGQQSASSKTKTFGVERFHVTCDHGPCGWLGGQGRN